MTTNADTKANKPKKEPLNKKPAPSNTKEGSKVELEIRSIEFNVYFDGTWNSKFNSNWYNNSNWYANDTHIVDGKEQNHDPKNTNEDKARKKYKADETSFARAPTGVDQMHRAASTDDPYIIPLYVDGSGTTTPSDDPYALDDVNDYKGSKDEMKSDSAYGSGVGRGDTGVYAKLEKMCEQIQKKLRAVNVIDVNPRHTVIFNVYGFSRGAATARMFVHRIIKEKHDELLKDYKLDLTQYTVMVKFVGLFDTVSSIGLSHTNDVKKDKQGLDFAKGAITGKIVHLVAGHEFRQKFSVTSIQQAVQSGYGFEVVLPGNHTDLGDGKGTEKSYQATIKNGVKTESWELSANQDRKTILQHSSAWSPFNMITTAGKTIFGAGSEVVRDQRDMEKAMNNASLEKAMQILINQGWFINAAKTEKTVERKEIWIEEDFPHKMLKVNRKLSQGYPKVPAWVMIELIKEEGAYRLKDNLLMKYAIETTQDATLRKIYNDIQPQVMAKWKKEFKTVSPDATKKGSLFNQTNLFENIIKDAQKQKNYIFGSIVNNSQQLLPYVTVSDLNLRNTMFNKYLQWSSDVGQGAFKEESVSVGLPRITPETNQFYRTVISG